MYARSVLSYDRAMKKSIGDNMIPKDWGFEKGLELIKKAGFDGVELWLGDAPWFQTTTSDSGIRDLRRKIENAGLIARERRGHAPIGTTARRAGGRPVARAK